MAGFFAKKKHGKMLKMLNKHEIWKFVECECVEMKNSPDFEKLCPQAWKRLWIIRTRIWPRTEKCRRAVDPVVSFASVRGGFGGFDDDFFRGGFGQGSEKNVTRCFGWVLSVSLPGGGTSFSSFSSSTGGGGGMMTSTTTTTRPGL